MGLLGLNIGPKQRVQFIQNASPSIPSATIIEFDASLKETHIRNSPATRFPLEDGTNISDHVISEPFELDITAIITDSPIGGITGLLTETATTLTSSLVPPVGLIGAAGAYALISGLKENRSVSYYNQILQLQDNKQPFDVLTSIYRYPSMWITSLSVPRDSETGSSLIFTMKLTQLILVRPQSVSVQIFANPALASNQANLGQQSLANTFQQGAVGGVVSTLSLEEKLNILLKSLAR